MNAVTQIDVTRMAGSFTTAYPGGIILESGGDVFKIGRFGFSFPLIVEAIILTPGNIFDPAKDECHPGQVYCGESTEEETKNGHGPGEPTGINMNDIDYEIKVRLIVSHMQILPEEITNVLDITPTKTWQKGQKVHNKAINSYKHNGWLLSPGTYENNLSNQIDNILEIVWPKKSNIKCLPEGSCLELSCIVYIYNSEPELNISIVQLRKLSELGCGIDFDLYHFPNDEDKGCG